MKVVNQLRIKVPYSSSEDSDAKRNEHFTIVTKLIKRADSKRYSDDAAATADAAEARVALANAKLAVDAAKTDEARALAEADVVKLSAAYDAAQAKAPKEAFNIIEDRVLAVEGLEGTDEAGNDLSDPKVARAYLIEDLRMSTAATRAIFDAVNATKTGN